MRRAAYQITRAIDAVERTRWYSGVVVNRAWLLLVVPVVVLAVWLARRDRGETTPAPAPDLPTRVAPTVPRRVDPMTPPRPTEPAAPPVAEDDAVVAVATDPVPPSVADSVPFEREARDPAWAVDQERELALRLDRLVDELRGKGKPVTITGAECRRTLCRVEVRAATSGELSALYGALETPEGLYGWADTIVLGAVDTDATTGAVTTSILAQFERSE